MQPTNRLFDDLAKLVTNALGVAQGARAEAETALRSWFERWIAASNLVTREEFDAVRAMAQKAREENAALAQRLAQLEATVAKLAEAIGHKETGEESGASQHAAAARGAAEEAQAHEPKATGSG